MEYMEYIEEATGKPVKFGIVLRKLKAPIEKLQEVIERHVQGLKYNELMDKLDQVEIAVTKLKDTDIQ